MSTPTNTDDHVAERIPWEQLTVQPPPDRRRMVYAAALVILAGTLAIVAVRQFTRPAPAFTPVELIDPPVATTEATPVPTGESVVGPPTAPLLSEADLMAVDPAGLERSVAAQAEMIVLEFFSVDPGDDWAARLSDLSGWSIPESDRPSPPAPEAVSYVEWVATYAVAQVGTGHYRATVLVRRMVAADGQAFERLPVEWVELDLELGSGGGSKVTGLPVPTDPVVDASGWPEPSATWVGPGGFTWPSG